MTQTVEQAAITPEVLPPCCEICQKASKEMEPGNRLLGGPVVFVCEICLESGR